VRVAEHQGELWVAHTDLCIPLADARAAIEKAGTKPIVYLRLDWEYQETLGPTEHDDILQAAQEVLRPVCRHVVLSSHTHTRHLIERGEIAMDIALLDDMNTEIGAEIAVRLLAAPIISGGLVLVVPLGPLSVSWIVRRRWAVAIAIASVVLTDRLVPARISPKGLLPYTPKPPRPQGMTVFRDFV
jgi:hypothetical protein